MKQRDCSPVSRGHTAFTAETGSHEARWAGMPPRGDGPSCPTGTCSCTRIVRAAQTESGEVNRRREHVQRPPRPHGSPGTPSVGRSPGPTGGCALGPTAAGDPGSGGGGAGTHGGARSPHGASAAALSAGRPPPLHPGRSGAKARGSGEAVGRAPRGVGPRAAPSLLRQGWGLGSGVRKKGPRLARPGERVPPQTVH